MIWQKWAYGVMLLRPRFSTTMAQFLKYLKYLMSWKLSTSTDIFDSYLFLFELLFNVSCCRSKLVLACNTRTVWEIKQKTLVDMAVGRGCYIDQSQSLNIYMEQPDPAKLTSLHFYTWSKVSFFMQDFDFIKFTIVSGPKRKKNIVLWECQGLIWHLNYNLMRFLLFSHSMI